MVKENLNFNFNFAACFAAQVGCIVMMERESANRAGLVKEVYRRLVKEDEELRRTQAGASGMEDMLEEKRQEA